MNDNIDIMDKAIKEKFDGHEVPVPSNLWNSIESKLTPINKKVDNGFDFKNPFVFFIILISTASIGAYWYHANNQQTNNSTTLLKNTIIAEDSLSNFSTDHKTSSYDQSSKEENNLITNSVSKMDIDNTDQTLLSSSDLHSAKISNNRLSKKQEKQNIDIAKSIQHTAAASENDATTKNYFSPKDSKHSEINKKKQQYNAAANNNTANNSNQREHSNIVSNNASTKEIENTNTHSNSISASELDQPRSIHVTSPVSNNIQTSNQTDLNDQMYPSTHIDSIKLYASAFLKEFDSPKNINNTDVNNPISKNVLINDTENTSTSHPDADLTDTPISSNLLLLNTTNTLSKPSETESLYNQHLHTNETNVSELKNQTLASKLSVNATSHTSTKSIDTINNKNSIENLFHTNSNLTNDTNYLAHTNNQSTKELALKIDSTIVAEQIDTTSLQQQTATTEVKSSTEEDKKKNLFLSRCSIDGYATPALGYLYLSPNANYERINELTEERNKNANAGFGITTGLRMNYALTQKIEIGIGFQYSSLSQPSSLTQQILDSSYYTYQGYNKIDSAYNQQTQQMVYTTRFVVTDSSTINVYSTSVRKHIDKYQNFSIPIHIAYGYSISSKLSLLARTSLLINYKTYSLTYLNESDSTVVGHHSSKDISFGGSFSIGGYYQFARRYSVFVEPIITYYFANVFDKQSPFKQKQLMLGLQTGIRLSF